MKTTVQRWGNSHGIRIPKAILEGMGLAAGAEVHVEISEDRSQITITPASEERPVRGRYRIEDLIVTSSPKAMPGETGWGGPEGKEIW